MTALLISYLTGFLMTFILSVYHVKIHKGIYTKKQFCKDFFSASFSWIAVAIYLIFIVITIIPDNIFDFREKKKKE